MKIKYLDCRFEKEPFVRPVCPMHGQNLENCIKNLYDLKLDKSDNRILEIDINDLKEKIKCDLSLIKLLIIRLRRKKSLDDWNLFKNILEKNIDFILDHQIKVYVFIGTRLRWLISILDTYVDNGNEVESRNAMIAILFYRNEKIFSTLTDNYLLTKKPYSFNHSKSLCGFHINGKSDSIINLFRRLDVLFSETPLILKIFRKVISRIMEDKESLLHRVSDKCNNYIFKNPINDFIDY